MICPQKFNSTTLDWGGGPAPHGCQCVEAECALWNKYEKECSELTANMALRLMAEQGVES